MKKNYNGKINKSKMNLQAIQIRSHTKNLKSDRHSMFDGFSSVFIF